MNSDGVFSLSDTSNFVEAVVDSVGFAAGHPNVSLSRADMNCDGYINGVDITAFVKKLLAP